MIRYELNGRSIFWLFAVVAGFFGYKFLDGTGSEDSRLRDGHMSQLARKVAIELPKLDGRPKVAVAPFVNDNHGEVAEQIKLWVGRQNVQIVEPTWIEKSWSYVQPREASVVEAEIERAGKSSDCRYLIYGEVIDWVTFPVEQSRLRAKVQLWDVQTARTIYDREVVVPESQSTQVPPQKQPSRPSTGDNLANVRATVTAWRDPLLIGAGAWLIAVFLSPWLFAGAISSLLARESNAVNAGLIAFFGAVMAGLAWVAWGRWLDTAYTPLALVAAVLLTIPYFGFVCGHIDATRT
ncbi:MAG: hypothetical protein ACKV2Q_29865 [Planctomycetaceae bacterium]